MTIRHSAAALAVAAAFPAAAQNVAVTFGTNWVAQAEHGGYYQAVADGTYAACGLDVTILPGGPQVNNRALMLAGHPWWASVALTVVMTAQKLLSRPERWRAMVAIGWLASGLAVGGATLMSA